MKPKPPHLRRSENLNIRMSPVEIDAFYVLALVKKVKAARFARFLLLREVKRELRRRAKSVKP